MKDFVLSNWFGFLLVVTFAGIFSVMLYIYMPSQRETDRVTQITANVLSKKIWLATDDYIKQTLSIDVSSIKDDIEMSESQLFFVEKNTKYEDVKKYASRNIKMLNDVSEKLVKCDIASSHKGLCVEGNLDRVARYLAGKPEYKGVLKDMGDQEVGTVISRLKDKIDIID